MPLDNEGHDNDSYHSNYRDDRSLGSTMSQERVVHPQSVADGSIDSRASRAKGIEDSKDAERVEAARKAGHLRNDIGDEQDRLEELVDRNERLKDEIEEKNECIKR